MKRWSLSASDSHPRSTDTTSRESPAADPPEPDLELELEQASDPLNSPAALPAPSPAAMAGHPLPAGIERELRELHAAIADLRHEVRALRTGHEEPR